MREPSHFVADAMLGRLARWLRVLDFDTLYDPGADDHALVRLADYERRAVLTRDRHLVEHLRPARALLIRSEAPLVQLREVVDAYRLTPPVQCFIRCMVCNSRLRTTTAEEYRMRVPPDLILPVEAVRRCPGCGRVYWPGSHTRRMLERLRGVLPEWNL